MEKCLAALTINGATAENTITSYRSKKLPLECRNKETFNTLKEIAKKQAETFNSMVFSLAPKKFGATDFICGKPSVIEKIIIEKLKKEGKDVILIRQGVRIAINLANENKFTDKIWTVFIK